MKNIFIFFLIMPVVVSGQFQFRPIMDSALTCSYHKGLVAERYFDPNTPKKYTEKLHLEVFYIAEQMPIPVINIEELEKVLSEKVNLNDQEKKSSNKMHFQCIVNCKGICGDFQIIHCPDNFTNICCQTLAIIREKLSNWQSGKQKDHNIDMLISVIVEMDKGKFKVFAPVY